MELASVGVRKKCRKRGVRALSPAAPCTVKARYTTDDVSCAGHRADDLLPFTGLWAGQTTKLSNSEFYEFVSPTNTQMPYVYDKVSYWPACPEGKIYYGADYVPPGGATDDLGVVGAMRR